MTNRQWILFAVVMVLIAAMNVLSNMWTIEALDMLRARR